MFPDALLNSRNIASKTQLDTAAAVPSSLATPISCTDAQRLDGSGPVSGAIAGQLVKVTDQANRIERYLGGGYASNQNWLVVRNTILVLATLKAGSLAVCSINGIPLIAGVTVWCGWLSPENVPITSNNWKMDSVLLDIEYLTSTVTLSMAGNIYSGNRVFLTNVSYPRGIIYLQNFDLA